MISSVVNRAGWYLSLYPSAGEGGGCFRASVPRRESSEYVAKGSAANPERAAEEAGRRARGRLRRYCSSNRLNRLGTLTYAGEGCHDVEQVRLDVGDFFRNLRTGLGGNPLPYAWVPEWHKTHGLHLHFAVGRFVPRGLIDEAWGRGFVHIKLLGNMGHGATSLDEARRAAGYLSKYVAKTFTETDARLLGLHRYDLAQGFQPAKVSLYARSRDGLIDLASQTLESPPSKVWTSDETPGWQGALAVWAQWPVSRG